MNESEKQIQTVLGPIAPEHLGVTLTHEHLLNDLLAVPEENQSSHSMAYKLVADKRSRWEEPISLANCYEARRNPFLFRDALQMLDPRDALEALALYRDAGGDCIVDVTPMACGRDPEELRRLSEESGITIVMGTGYYVRDFHPSEISSLAEEEIAERIMIDITEGTGDNAVKPGIIGEIGLTWPVHPDEAKVLRAATGAQVNSGLSMQIHPGRDTAAPLEAIRLVEDAGGDPERTIICHIDRTLFEIEDMIELARTGCYLEFDLFGWETSHYPLSEIDMPNDGRRAECVIALSEAGFEDQILVSHDVDSKTRLAAYGGEGFGHLLSNVVPIFRRKGMEQSDIDRLFIENPRRCLQHTAPNRK